MHLGRYCPAEVRLGLQARDLPGDTSRHRKARRRPVLLGWCSSFGCARRSLAWREDRPMRALASITIAILLAVGVTQTYADRAPGGWDYPFECCSEADCARIDASEVPGNPVRLRRDDHAGPASDVG